jgi:hypothetical protein
VTHDPKKGDSLIFLDCGIVTNVTTQPTSFVLLTASLVKTKKEQFRSLLDICLALLHYDGRKAADLLADHNVQVSPYETLHPCPLAQPTLSSVSLFVPLPLSSLNLPGPAFLSQTAI